MKFILFYLQPAGRGPGGLLWSMSHSGFVEPKAVLLAVQ
jgi:hypothetical protein